MLVIISSIASLGCHNKFYNFVRRPAAIVTSLNEAPMTMTSIWKIKTSSTSPSSMMRTTRRTIIAFVMLAALMRSHLCPMRPEYLKQ